MAGWRTCALATLLGTSALPMAALAQCPADRPLVAHITSAFGPVTVAGRPVAAVEAGGEHHVCAGDLVEVGDGGRAAVRIPDADSFFRLDANTRTRIAAPREPQSGLVELLRGSLYFLSEVRRTLDVRTAYSNAGVEGTEVLIRVDPDSRRPVELVVFDGVVALSDPAEPAAVRARVPTGTRVVLDPAGAVVEREDPPADAPYRPLREAVGRELAWTLFYPEVLVADEAARFPRIAEAAALLARGRVEAARAVLASVPRETEETGLAAALEAVTAVAQGEDLAAAAAVDQALALAPASPTPLLAQSLLLQSRGAIDDAAAATRRAAALAPGSVIVRARLAEVALIQGRIREARQEAQAAVAAGGGALALMVEGYVELAALDPRAAEAALRQSLTLDPQNPTARLGLGLALIRQGELAAGRALLEDTVAHDPGRAQFRSYLGRAYAAEARDEPAARQLAIAKELDPTDPTPWYVEAVRAQLANRPVDALRELDRSIELNDARAPFRSRLQLDRDRAVRQTTAAGIYDRLGFDRPAALEAARAVELDPTSYVAHRSLADSYARLPRFDVARVSAQLQGQLLQPPSRAPILPRLDYSDLTISSVPNAFGVGLGEYGALFEQEGFGFAGGGILGSQDTWGQELSGTYLRGNLSLGAGQLYSDTDGFRRNADVTNSLQSVLGQARLFERLDVQLEYRRRETDQGDLQQRFDQDAFSRTDTRKITQHTGRLGLNFEIDPGQNLLGSLFWVDREEKLDNRGAPNTDAEDKGYQAEIQYRGVGARGSAILGLSAYDIDVDRVEFGTPVTFDREHQTGYGYLTLPVGRDLEVVLGASADRYRQRRQDIDKLSGKLGVRWQALPGLQLRAALLDNVKRSLVVQQTIEPTTVVGFNQFYDDINGTKTRIAAVGADLRLGRDWLVGGELGRRWLEKPEFLGNEAQIFDQDERFVSAYLGWIPHPRWSIYLEPSNEIFSTEQTFFLNLDRVETRTLPLRVTYNHPSGFFASVRGALVHQDVRFTQPAERSDTETFFTLDLAAGYRLREDRGTIVLQATNILDQGFDYRDDNYRTSEQRLGSFVPAAAILLRANLRL